MIVRQSRSLYVAGAVAIGLTTVQQLLTARGLGSSQFGQLATALATVTFALLIVDVRSWELGMRLMAEPLAQRDHVEVSRSYTCLLAAEVALGTLGMVGVMLVAPWLSRTVFGDREVGDLMRTLAVIMPLRQVAAGVSVALVRMDGRYGWLSVRAVSTAASRLLLVAGPALAGLGPKIVALGVVLSELIAATSMGALARLAFRRRGGGSLLAWARPRSFDDSLPLARSLWVSASIKGLHLESFLPLAAAFTAPTQVALLRSGLDIANLTTSASAPLSIVTSPNLIRLAGDPSKGDELRENVRDAQKVYALVGWGICFAAGVAVLLVVPPFLGPGYEALRPVALLLLIGYAVQTTALWVRPVLVGTDSVKAQNRLGVVLGMLALLSLPVLVHHFDAVGGAANMLLFLLVYSTMSRRLARKVLSDA